MKNNLFRQLVAIALVLFAALIGKAQVPNTEEETIKVQTDVTQIAVSLDAKNTERRWELFENNSQIKDFGLDTPQNAPLNLVILILQTESNPRDFINRASKINKRLKAIEKQMRLQISPVVINYNSKESKSTIEFPSKWKVIEAESLAGAVNNGVEMLQSVGAGSRRALLIISDATEGLPMDILEKTDIRLLKRSALVFYMGVAVKKEGKNRKTIVALSNIQGGKFTIFGSDYIDNLFDYFVGIASNLYVLSFQNNTDATSSEVKVFAYNNKNELVGRNERMVKTISVTEGEAKNEK